VGIPERLEGLTHLGCQEVLGQPGEGAPQPVNHLVDDPLVSYAVHPSMVTRRRSTVNPFGPPAFACMLPVRHSEDIEVVAAHE